MNEKCGDTLVQRVMKKVEELKLWQMKNSKNGFAAVYADVLREVESLPESDVKVPRAGRRADARLVVAPRRKERRAFRAREGSGRASPKRRGYGVYRRPRGRAIA